MENIDSPSKGEVIRRYITRIRDLPTLPGVVTDILQIINSDNSSAGDLSKAVSMDQALAANVLKLANSAFYGFSRKISTINEAVIHLGFNVVRCLAVSVSVIDAFKEGEGRENFNRPAFWRHSIGCGVVSRMLAIHTKKVDPEVALLSGILHDLGKLVLDRFMDVDFVQILQIAKEQEMTFLQAEKLYYDIDHAMIGAWLAEWWKLPKNLSEPIRYHHSPGAGDRGPMVGIVTLANAICHEKSIDNSGYSKVKPVDHALLESLGLDETSLGYVNKNLDEEIEKASIFESLTG